MLIKNKQMKTKDNTDNNPKYKPLIFLFILIIIIWLLSWIAIRYFISEWDKRAYFGDAFGAISALFSGLAFGGIIYTIMLQREELKLQRIELQETRKELARSADAQEKSEQALSEQITSMKLSAKLNALNSLINYYQTKMENSSGFTEIEMRQNKDKYANEIIKTLIKINELIGT
jgi:hypothetical protein